MKISDEYLVSNLEISSSKFLFALETRISNDKNNYLITPKIRYKINNKAIYIGYNDEATYMITRFNEEEQKTIQSYLKKVGVEE